MRRTGSGDVVDVTGGTPRPIGRRLVVGAVLALLFGTTGCGDDDGAADDATTTTTSAGAPDDSSSTTSTSGAATPTSAATGSGASAESPEVCALFDDETFLQAWVPSDAPGLVVEGVEVVPEPDTAVADSITAATEGCVRRVVVSYVDVTGTSDTVSSVAVAPFTGDVAQPVDLVSGFPLTWTPVEGRADAYLAAMGMLPIGGVLVVGDLAYVILNGEIESDAMGGAIVYETDAEADAAAAAAQEAQLASVAEAERDLVAALDVMAATLG